MLTLVAVVTTTTTALTTANAQQAPAEKPKQTLTRTEGMAVLGANLSRNQFRTEEYQANYTEKVPYQATESYTESIPYQTTESYIDYETRYEQRHVCRNEYRQECRQERECRYVPGQQVCRTDRLCEPGGSTQQCQMVTECGTTALGQPICKDRQVCREVSGSPNCRDVQTCTAGNPREECHFENRCRQVPYQNCSYESVPVQEAVTKYRTVTKYREEYRTRTVTKYRDETKCCVTKTRSVFDRQTNVAVVINMPVDAILAAGESESLTAELSQDGQTVRISVNNSIYGYQNLTSQVSGGTATINLALAPKWSDKDLGEASIERLALRWANGEVSALISDKGSKLKVSTQYRVRVINPIDQAVLAEAVGSPASTSQTAAVLTQIPLNADIAKDQELNIELTVVRNGLVLGAPVSFTKMGRHSKNNLDAKVFLGKDKITGLQTKGQGSDTYVRFVDSSPENEDVETTYDLTLTKVIGGQKTVIFSKSISRPEVQLNSKGVTLLYLRKYGLDSFGPLTVGSKVTLEMKVTRVSNALNDGSPAEYNYLKSDVLSKVE